MDDPTLTVTGSCRCGACAFELRSPAKSRLICHCTICQAFTGRANSDVAIVPAWRVSLRNVESIAFRHFKRYRFPPPNLNRGRCRNCDRPVVEIGGPRFMQIYFLPAATFAQPEQLPAPAAHIFYEHRRAAWDDAIRKHEGYFSSQAAAATMIRHSL